MKEIFAHLATEPFDYPLQAVDFLASRGYRCIGRGYSSKIFDVEGRAIRIFFDRNRSDDIEIGWLNYCERNRRNPFLLNVDWVRKFRHWHIASLEKLNPLTERWRGLIKETPFISYEEMEIVYPQLESAQDLRGFDPLRNLDITETESVDLFELWGSMVEAYCFIAHRNPALMDVKIDSFMLRDARPILIDPVAYGTDAYLRGVIRP